MWLFFALLSALSAAFTAVLVKIGTNGVNGILATIIRTAVVLVMVWGMVFLMHTGQRIFAISQKSQLFLILSGFAAGASWLYYYHALQLGRVNQVASIDKLSIIFTIFFAVLPLREELTPKSALGCALITLGAVLMAL